MRHLLCPLLLAVLVLPVSAQVKLPPPMVTGLDIPMSVAIGSDGRVYASTPGAIGKDGDGAVMVIDKGKAVPFVTGLDDPIGLVNGKDGLYVADKQRLVRIDRQGKVHVVAGPDDFPTRPQNLTDLAVDENGVVYAVDFGDVPERNAIYRIAPKNKPKLVVDGRKNPALKAPLGILQDSQHHLLVSDANSGAVHRVKIADGSSEKAADFPNPCRALAFDRYGRLYATTSKDSGKAYVQPRPGEVPVLLAEGFQLPWDLCLGPTGTNLLVADTGTGTITALPTTVPGQEVDETPMPLESAIAFPDLEWTGWKKDDPSGKIVPLRPIVLTHAGDGSDRVFVATQHGVIHVFPNDQKAKKTKVFLDIQDRVKYDDKSNEEGFLGLAFHPEYKKNREFYVFYTLKKPLHTNVLSRFKAKADDPDQADPASEEVLLTVQHKYWNHDGGTVVFGPDGYLYLALGDGGSANDPDENGQKLSTLLGKIIRIDVNHKEGEPGGVSPRRNYAIPKDNPFVDREGVRPEIWAYGLRNVWRMAFDPKTGKLWAGEVGQNLWEEINIIEKGGNYGWNLRESLHPFGPKGVGPRKDLIDPIWEYHHDTGKSITGGLVYRGKRLPDLDGHYLYADYVTAKIWALKYDEGKKRVVANRPIRNRNVPVLSFGEDEKGEAYYMTYTPTGKGIYWFVPAKR